MTGIRESVFGAYCASTGRFARAFLGVVLVATAAVGLSAVATDNARGAVLYSQLDDVNLQGFPSQEFMPGWTKYTAAGADDFAVPPGKVWQITKIEFPGAYGDINTVAESMNIALYRSTVGSDPEIPKATPYVSVQRIPLSDESTATGDLVVVTNVVAGPGTSWLAAQAWIDDTTYRTWFWNSRDTQSGNAATWFQTDTDAWTVGAEEHCLVWKVRKPTCDATPSGPDNSFALHGIEASAKLSAKAAKPKKSGKVKVAVNANNIGKLTLKAKGFKTLRKTVVKIGKLKVTMKAKPSTIKKWKAGVKIKKPKVKAKLPKLG